MNNTINDLMENDMIGSEHLSEFWDELKTAMTQYRKKNNLTIREYSNRVNVSIPIIFAIRDGILPIQDITLGQLISLYRLHKYDMKHYTMNIIIEHKE